MDFGATASQEHLVLRGSISGHNGWVTSLATSPEAPDMLLSGSRDKSLMKWKVTREDPEQFAVAEKRLTGHGHYVSDVVISSDANFAVSGSWDSNLRLWNLNTGETTKQFVGHSKDVLSVAFSADNRQIVSGSRDRMVNLWNILGEVKFQFDADGHTDWVSCVQFSPNLEVPVMVSAGWDKVVKVWDLTTCKLKCNLRGHTGYVNVVSVSPDGSLCASGGKDGTAMLWDLNEGRALSSLSAGDVINSMTFSPNRYWLCAATASSIKVWNLETKACVDELTIEQPHTGKKAVPIQCISLCWSPDGNTLYAGYTDNKIRVWSVSSGF